jgi:hypothetical protein
VVTPENLLITTKYVREVLDQIVQATSNKIANPLESLQIIDLHMLDADFTFFQNPRRFVLNDLLVSTIHAQYLKQRNLHTFSPVEIGMKLSNTTQTITEDASTGNADLIGWSWLYFHYVEVSLRISQQQFCRLVNLDDRTIRRYQNNTIDALKNQLVRMEQNAREQRRKQAMYSELPHQGAIIELLERQNESQLIRKSKLKHFYIVGAAGIGKTVFVEQILKEKIDNDAFDRLIWIHSPDNIENIKSYLQERLLGDDAKITLVEFISLKKTVIVIDNAENLQAHLVALQKFLQQFSHAEIYLTSHVFRPLPECLEIELHELSLQAVQAMLRDKNDGSVAFGTNEDVRLVWQVVGGNPLAIELLTQNSVKFEMQSATLLTLSQLFSHLFDELTVSEQLAWLILALLNGVVADTAQLNSLLHVTADDFIMLERLSIAKTIPSEKPNITLTVSASRFIQLRYEYDLVLQHEFDQVTADLYPDFSSASEINLRLAEAVLSVSWVMLSAEYRLEIAHGFWKAGLATGHYTVWHIILGKFVSEIKPQSLDLAIAFGICQRWLGQWKQAYSTFNALVEYTGMRGLFAIQANALIELVVLLRYQGDYDHAVAELDLLDHIPSARIDDEPLRNRALVERIEIALEQNRLDNAKTLFENLPDTVSYYLVLELEIYVRDNNTQSDLPFLMSISEKLLLDFKYNPSLLARIHVLMGRVHQKISETEAAIRHLTIAFSILTESDNDPFALARTESNLAALFIDTNQFFEAQELLKSAENIQRKIGDRTGLATTMHNVHVLNRKIVN